VFDKLKRVFFSARDMLELLKCIKSESLKELGWCDRYALPEWAILTVIPVAPPCCRPTARHNGVISRDGMTYRYAEIIKLNNNLSGLRSAPEHVIKDLVAQQQWYVTTMMDSNEQSGEYNRSRREKVYFEGWKQRLTGKEGRIRKHLSGKRCDYTARTVITGDANIDVDEVGVPPSIAKRLTVPRKVTSLNLKEMRNCILSGDAVAYTDREGRRYSLKYYKPQMLHVGDTIDCSLKNGDIVLMNRQPSLHRGP